MRRFFVWSALAAVIGLALAIGGFWAYQHFWARFQPVTITREQATIQRLLDEASWVSAGGGGEPLYIVGYRDSGAMQAYEREEAPKLRAAGVDVRIIVFARADREGMIQSTAAERATVADLWLSRDWTLYQRWTATPVRNWTAAGIPAADGNLARSAVVEASRQFVSKLGEALAANGLRATYPLIVWRDREGFLKACACSDRRSWAFIRDDLDAPDRAAPSALDTGGVQPPAPQTFPGDGSPEGPAYPTLPTIPPAGGTVAPAQPGQSAPTTPNAAPATPSQPGAQPAPTPRRPLPAPTKQDDSTFF